MHDYELEESLTEALAEAGRKLEQVNIPDAGSSDAKYVSHSALSSLLPGTIEGARVVEVDCGDNHAQFDSESVGDSRASISARIRFEGGMHKSAYSSHDMPDIHIIDPDLNDSYLEVSFERNV